MYWLNNFEISFPHPNNAAADGLLALGGDLRPERLMLAYRYGIFPWFAHQGTYHWFSPNPRCVLFPENLKVHKSMRSIFNQQKFTYTLDTDFERIMRACAGQWRRGQIGSWISDDFVEAYLRLHRLGMAHSVEVWKDGELAGGLYGIALGRIFSGESMFAYLPNASKAGFITLVRALEQMGFWFVDCQIETEHLLSLGSENISRQAFLELLLKNQHENSLVGRWSFAADGGIACEMADWRR